MRLHYRLHALVAMVALTGMVGCAATPPKERTVQHVDDSVITTRVKAAIFDDPSLKSADIDVATVKGRVQLSGFVGTRANMSQAVALAQGIAGVTSVKSDMRLR
jgi:osmotically-inducible protein OsmY